MRAASQIVIPFQLEANVLMMTSMAMTTIIPLKTMLLYTTIDTIMAKASNMMMDPDHFDKPE